MARTGVKIKHAFGSYDGDPMPMALIAVGLILSVVSLAVGVALGWQGLVANVAANLVIIGPGLLVTNVLVGGWREEKVAKQAAPLIRLILNEAVASLVAASELATKLGASVGHLDRPEGKGAIHLPDMASVRSALEVHVKVLDPYDESNIPTELEMNRKLLEIADLRLIERIVTHIGALFPAPDALVWSTMASHYYETYTFHSTVGYIPNKNRIRDTQTGFLNFRRSAIDNGVSVFPNITPFYVHAGCYVEFVWKNMGMLIAIIDALHEAMPRSLVDRTGPLMRKSDSPDVRTSGPSN